MTPYNNEKLIFLKESDLIIKYMFKTNNATDGNAIRNILEYPKIPIKNEHIIADNKPTSGLNNLLPTKYKETKKIPRYIKLTVKLAVS